VSGQIKAIQMPRAETHISRSLPGDWAHCDPASERNGAHCRRAPRTCWTGCRMSSK